MNPSPESVLVAVILVAVAAAVIVVATLIRRRRNTLPLSSALVPDGVVRGAGIPPASIRDALIAALVPVEVEYRPLNEVEVSRLRTVRLTGPELDAVLAVARVVRVPALPRNEKLVMEVILPAGKQLTPAKGIEGAFRAFSRDGRAIDAQALLRHVPKGDLNAAAPYVVAGLTALAAAGVIAYAVHSSTKRRTKETADRLDIEYAARVTAQRTTEEQLDRAISLLLDGRTPAIEPAIAGATAQFQQARQFLEKHRGVIEGALDADGRVAARRLDKALGDAPNAAERFARELRLSRSAIATYRKSILTEAAAAALADPGNPHSAYRRHLDGKIRQAEEAEAIAAEITDCLLGLELKPGWLDDEQQTGVREKHLRSHLSPGTEERYLLLPDGGVMRVLPPEDGEAGAAVRA